MAWQIQCKQHFLKQLYYTKQPTREWGDPYLTWGCANILLRLYESKRGSERSNVLLLNMYESLWKLYEVMWDLLREVLWYESCVRVVWGVRWSKYSLNPDRPRLDKTRWDMTKTYGKTDLTRLDGLTDHI